MRKSVLVVSGVVASVMGAVLPNGTVSGLPISPHPRDPPQDHNETGATMEGPDIDLPNASENDEIVYIPVIITPDESFLEPVFTSTITVTKYVMADSLKPIKTFVVPLGGAVPTYSAIRPNGPAFANRTMSVDICATGNSAMIKPSGNRLVVPSHGLNSSTTVNSYDLPGIAISTSSFGLPKPSTLPASSGLPKSPPFLSQGNLGTRNPFSQVRHFGLPAMNQIAVGMVSAAFLMITGSLITSF